MKPKRKLNFKNTTDKSREDYLDPTDIYEHRGYNQSCDDWEGYIDWYIHKRIEDLIDFIGKDDITFNARVEELHYLGGQMICKKKKK